MPSGMPSSLSYYQDKGRNHGNGWENLESQASALSAQSGREMETVSKLENVGDSQVHAIGENIS